MLDLYLGNIFTLKSSVEQLRRELIPSFDQVLESWIEEVGLTGYADPNYFLEVTYLTDPLKLFVERITSSLQSHGVSGGTLERGFGFGKTHSLILLWHLFTSNVGARIGADVPSNVVRESLVLGFDFASKNNPFARIISELEAYRRLDHPVSKLKDPELIRAVNRVLSSHGKQRLYSITSDELAKLITSVLEKYNELGGQPRLLMLADELGYGLAKRMRRFSDYLERGEKEKALAIYNEANSIINFLSYLYEELHNHYNYSSVVIWVMAEQDRREMNALLSKYRDNDEIYSKIKGLMDDLDNLRERYSRALAGTGIAELSYSPVHAIEIAVHRLLRPVHQSIDDIKEAYLSNMKIVAGQLGLSDVVDTFKDDILKYYPFSLGMTRLLRKVMYPRDMPGTEYVRTVLYIVAQVAERALREDPTGTYTISVKHLTPAEAIQAKLIGELEADWIQAGSDIEMALDKLDDRLREPAELAVKYILAKGVTSNIVVLLESEKEEELKRYASTLDEIQVEALQAYKPPEVIRVINNLYDALERVKAESARIDERELSGKRYFVPSFFKTIYSKHMAFVLEERREAERDQLIPIYIVNKGTIPSLLSSISIVIDGRRDDVSVAMLEFNKVWDTSTLTSHPVFTKAQRNGRLLIVLVPPWDLILYNKLSAGETTYDQIIEGLAKKLQAEVDRDRVKRPLHIIVLVPNLSKHRLDSLIEKLTLYEGTKRFLRYLDKSEIVLMDRLREYEDTIAKKRNLLEITDSEFKEKHLARLRNKIQKEISEARTLAQKQLVNLSREIVAETLSLYSKAVYYSLDEGRFVTKRLEPPSVGVPSGGLAEYGAVTSLERYSSIVTGFLKGVITGLNYQYKPLALMQAVLDHYKREFASHPLRDSDRIDEIVENLLQGTYGVKPLSLSLCREAVNLLNGQIIEYADKIIEIRVDGNQGLVLFEIKEKCSENSIECRGADLYKCINGEWVKIEENSTQCRESVPIPPEPVGPRVKPPLDRGEAQTRQPLAESTINLELPKGFNVEDIHQRIVAFMNEAGDKLKEISLILETDKTSLRFLIRSPDMESINNMRTVLNIFSRLSERVSQNIALTIMLAEPIMEETVKKFFGPYYSVQRSWDRYLP